MDAQNAVVARREVLDEIHAVAMRLEPDTLLALASGYAPRIVETHPDAGMSEIETIDEIVRSALAEDCRRRR